MGKWQQRLEAEGVPHDGTGLGWWGMDRLCVLFGAGGSFHPLLKGRWALKAPAWHAGNARNNPLSPPFSLEQPHVMARPHTPKPRIHGSMDPLLWDVRGVVLKCKEDAPCQCHRQRLSLAP